MYSNESFNILSFILFNTCVVTFKWHNRSTISHFSFLY